MTKKRLTFRATDQLALTGLTMFSTLVLAFTLVLIAMIYGVPVGEMTLLYPLAAALGMEALLACRVVKRPQSWINEDEEDNTWRLYCKGSRLRLLAITVFFSAEA